MPVTKLNPTFDLVTTSHKLHGMRFASANTSYGNKAPLTLNCNLLIPKFDPLIFVPKCIIAETFVKLGAAMVTACYSEGPA